MLRKRYALPIRSAWWEHQIRVECLAALAACGKVRCRMLGRPSRKVAHAYRSASPGLNLTARRSGIWITTSARITVPISAIGMFSAGNANSTCSLNTFSESVTTAWASPRPSGMPITRRHRRPRSRNPSRTSPHPVGTGHVGGHTRRDLAPAADHPIEHALQIRPRALRVRAARERASTKQRAQSTHDEDRQQHNRYEPPRRIAHRPMRKRRSVRNHA